MKKLIHFVTKTGNMVTVSPDSMIMELDPKEKKAIIRVGYKDFEITEGQAFNLIYAIQKDLQFIGDKPASQQEAQAIFQECVKSEFESPAMVISLNENRFKSLQKKVNALLVFTLRFMGFDPDKTDLSFVSDTFENMKLLRENNKNSSPELVQDDPLIDEVTLPNAHESSVVH